MEELWSLIDEQNIKTVIMLTETSSPSYTASRYLGTKSKATQGRFDVTFVEERKNTCYIQRIFKFKASDKGWTCHNGDETRRAVKQFEYTAWKDGDDVPVNPQSMIDLFDAVHRWQPHISLSHAVLVHCGNGFTRFGLGCVVMNELQRIRRDDGHINVVESVMLMKQRHRNIIPNFIAYARFGKATHILFCAVALFTNMVIVANLILAGKAAIEVLTKDVSSEFVVMILAVLFGSYCLVGGLGTTFYISYFNTALIFISVSLFILKITYLAEPDVEQETSIESLYATMSCLKGPDGNFQNSFLTFRTESGIIYGVVTLFMTIAIVFCDQANWQSRIAAKPKEGMGGFLIAGFLWFAIPTSISFVSSMTYKSLSFRNGTNLLTDEEIDKGYITPFVIQTLLGKEGCFLLLTMLTMTLVSTGSGEIMSVSSILVYDIIKTYIRPFRRHLQPTDCPLCGNSKLPMSSDMSESGLCTCISSMDCEGCAADIQSGLSGKLEYGFQYKCLVHGKYRHYEDVLLQYKTWCMIWVIIAIVPYGLLIIESGMDLNWAFLAAQVFIAPFQVPLFLTIAWARATAKGLLSGGILGLIAAVVGMLSYASTYKGGLSNFFVNTAQDWSLMTGLLSGLITSTLISVIVSLCTQERDRSGKPTKCSSGNSCSIKNCENFGKRNNSNECNSEIHGNIEWQKTMSIDNPLNPYRALYQEELASIDVTKHTVLMSHHMEEIFKGPRRVSYIAAVISLVVFLIVVPVVALSQEVLTENQLGTWLSVCQHWCLVGTVFVVLVPPIQKGIQIWRQYKTNKNMSVEENKTTSAQLHIKL